MTAQEPDILIFDGKKLPLISIPSHNDNIEAGFSLRTSNYRSYIASWEIQNGLLYLQGAVDGRMKFPGPIFADWVSGELNTWNGELLHYVHAGFGSMFEENIIFNIRNGVVADTRTESNVEKFCEDAIKAVKTADNKTGISRLYQQFLDPKGSLSKLIQKENANQAAYMLLQLELEELFKERLYQLSKDPKSGIVLQYKD